MPTPWFPCCVGTGTGTVCVCDDCGTANLVPDEWQVVMSGIVDDVCSDCDSGLDGTGFNDTFVLGNCQIGAFDVCLWYYELPSTTCQADYVLLTLKENTPGNWFFAVWAADSLAPSNPANKEFSFSKNYAARPDCGGLSGESLSPDLSPTQCDISSATCLVTAL